MKIQIMKESNQIQRKILSEEGLYIKYDPMTEKYIVGNEATKEVLLVMTLDAVLSLAGMEVERDWEEYEI